MDRFVPFGGDVLDGHEEEFFEDKLSENWGKCLNGDEAAFRITSAFHRIKQEAGVAHRADFCIIDVGPNFGVINRATFIAADYLIVPLAADLFSLQGLKNIGIRLEAWRSEWGDRSARNPEPDLPLPNGEIEPLGYVVMQHSIKKSRPVQSYLAWANRIPIVFGQFVRKNVVPKTATVEADENCLAFLKHFHSLVPMSMEVRKPIFLLKPADGAIGAHFSAVKRAYQDFKALSEKIMGLIS